MTAQVLVLPGDGIGPEIVHEARRVIAALQQDHGLDVELTEGLLGGCAVDADGEPYPAATREAARAADAVLLGAVGGPRWDDRPRNQRPESGLLAIRADLDLFANLRPAMAFPELAAASSLKAEIVAGLDVLIVRELTGGIYFGQPRGIEAGDAQQGRVGYNTLRYSETEVRRIGQVAFEAAKQRNHRLCSVDKANVLESSELWRDTINALCDKYPEVEVSHMYVDNAAMQLVSQPSQFDVIVTGNLFGDILSDIAAMLTGSIGMLPSASLNDSSRGLYEPVHGSAPDIAGQGIANPLATILSVAMMLRYSLRRADLADRVEAAVRGVLADGLRTADLVSGDATSVSTAEMGDAVVAALGN